MITLYAGCVESSPNAIVPHNRLTFDNQEVDAVRDVILSGQWACGPQVEALERALCAQSEAEYAVCVSSGLSALRLALFALGVREGDEVIVPAYSCVACANAVLALGGTPIPADILIGDLTIDPQSVQKRITPKTKAIIAINTFGALAQHEAISSFGIPVLEDCAHAFGMSIEGKQFGNHSDAAILSFYATKLLGAGEGGTVLTNDIEVANTVRSWRDYADRPAEALRLNDKMTDIEAALALSQLKRLPDMIAERQRLAKQYHKMLTSDANSSTFILPSMDTQRIWYRYAVRMHSMPVDECISKLHEHGIHAERPVERWVQQVEELPVTAKAYSEILSLPLYPTLSEDEQNRVSKAFLSLFHE